MSCSSSLLTSIWAPTPTPYQIVFQKNLEPHLRCQIHPGTVVPFVGLDCRIGRHCKMGNGIYIYIYIMSGGNLRSLFCSFVTMLKRWIIDVVSGERWWVIKIVTEILCLLGYGERAEGSFGGKNYVEMWLGFKIFRPIFGFRKTHIIEF